MFILAYSVPCLLFTCCGLWVQFKFVYKSWCGVVPNLSVIVCRQSRLLQCILFCQCLTVRRQFFFLGFHFWAIDIIVRGREIDGQYTIIGHINIVWRVCWCCGRSWRIFRCFCTWWCVSCIFVVYNLWCKRWPYCVPVSVCPISIVFSSQRTTHANTHRKYYQNHAKSYPKYLWIHIGWKMIIKRAWKLWVWFWTTIIMFSLSI